MRDARVPILVVSFLAAVLLPAAPSCLAGIEGRPDAQAASGGDDAHYEQVLRAYRGTLPAGEIEALAARDPAPALFTGPRSTPGHHLARFFAALPDRVHADLRREGYLKWKVETLPPQARRWVAEGVKGLGSAAPGLQAALAKGEVLTGFARVRIEGMSDPVYSWWIAGPEGRPAWVTLVRGRGSAGAAHSRAHEEQLPPLREKPDSPPVSEREWVKVRALRAEEPRPQALIDEKYYWSVVKAYRRELGREGLAALTGADSLLRKRLEAADPADRAVNDFFARLPDREHRTLIAGGRLVWRAEQLSRQQRRLLEPVVADLTTRAGLAGAGSPSVEPFSGTVFGLALVFVPEEKQPVVSWWARAPGALTPSWVSLTNGAALENPAYYRAHLQQLSR